MATFLECLDELEPGESYSLLASMASHYAFCMECGHVDHRISRRNDPCQTCGRPCDLRTSLFSDEGLLFQTICECYRSKDSRTLCVILFCTLMEQHLHHYLSVRCRRLGLGWNVIERLLNTAERWKDRQTLFKDVSGCSMDASLAETGMPALFKPYRELYLKRCRLVHGRLAYDIDENHIRNAVALSANSFSAFAYLHHKFCSVDGPELGVTKMTMLQRFKGK
ncbi:MAG: hypothetical protein NT105_18060 [Verrucomicrobia bacterium]|nr:hypothetical protein [Verrucomicrobiota bacterium]